MATKEKAEKQWKSDTLGEWKPSVNGKQSEAVTWKAQRTTAPNGNVLMGVRQYIVLKSKGEIAGKAGISFPAGPGLNKSIDAIIKLLQACKTAPLGKRVATAEGDEKPIKKSRSKKVDESFQHDEEADYVLVKNGSEYLKSARVVDGKVLMKKTEDGDEAQTFKKVRAEALLNKITSSGWKLQEV